MKRVLALLLILTTVAATAQPIQTIPKLDVTQQLRITYSTPVVGKILQCVETSGKAEWVAKATITDTLAKLKTANLTADSIFVRTNRDGTDSVVRVQGRDSTTGGLVGCSWNCDDNRWRKGAGNTTVLANNGDNVGIGTTTPTDKLHVTGTMKAENTDGNPHVFTNTDGSSQNTTVTLGYKNIVLNAINSNPTANVEGQINVADNVVTITEKDFENSTETSINLSPVDVTILAENGNVLMQTGTGNVGIGTATPDGKLDAIADDGGNVSRLKINGGDILLGSTNASENVNAVFGTNELRLNSNNGGDTSLFIFNPAAFTVSTINGAGLAKSIIDGNSSLLSINHLANSGNVIITQPGGTNNLGVGTSSPLERLHVVGNIYQSTVGNALIQKSPDGACWSLAPDNAGNAVYAPVTCP